MPTEYPVSQQPNTYLYTVPGNHYVLILETPTGTNAYLYDPQRGLCLDARRYPAGQDAGDIPGLISGRNSATLNATQENSPETMNTAAQQLNEACCSPETLTSILNTTLGLGAALAMGSGVSAVSGLGFGCTIA